MFDPYGLFSLLLGPTCLSLHSPPTPCSSFFFPFTEVMFFEWDPLTMGYFDNLDNGLLNKYKKILKKNYRCVLLCLD
jgi:hypothetical protein